MAIPIFVIGAPRSGTSWIANQLLQHEDIVGVTVENNNPHNLNPGIYESYFFTHLHQRYGDITHKASYIELLEILSAMDYFKIIGIDKYELYKLWPINYENLYRYIMDDFAKKNNAKYWLDKTPGHTRLINQITIFYPEAKFIAIQRDLVDVLKSSIKGYFIPDNSYKHDAHRQLYIKSTIKNYYYFTKIIDNYKSNRNNIIVLDYNSLKNDLAFEIKRITQFLNIEFNDSLLKQAYPPNTSFISNNEREHVLSTKDMALINKYSQIYKNLPLFLFNLRRFIPNRFRRRGRLLFMFAMSYPYIRG